MYCGHVFSEGSCDPAASAVCINMCSLYVGEGDTVQQRYWKEDRGLTVVARREEEEEEGMGKGGREGGMNAFQEEKWRSEEKREVGMEKKTDKNNLVDLLWFFSLFYGVRFFIQIFAV